MSSIAEVLREASQMLEHAGVPESRREAGSLLSFVIGRDRTFLISHSEDELDDQHVEELRVTIERRAAGEPLQYITGVQDFFGREFRVTPDVLIPRPETELLIEAALEVSKAPQFICDVGTGSGCIAITLLCELHDARAVAVDKSPAALEIAKINAQTLSAAHLAGLQREVRDHEPLVALSPGPDGLTIIRRLVSQAPEFLKTNGHLIMEIGFDQGEAVQQLIEANVWELLEVRPDLQCIPRIVVLRKR